MKRKKSIIAGFAVLASAGLATVVLSAPTASADVTGWEKVTVTDTVPANGGGTWNQAAYCTSGKKVMGGGWAADGPFPAGFQVVKDQPTGFSTGWNVNFVTGDTTVGVQIYAICATVS